jgi:thioredoxin 1
MTITILVTVLLIALIAGYMFYTYRKIKNTPEVESHKDILVLNDANFQARIKNGIVLVDFWAAWCMPCKMMAPVLNEAAEELGTTARIAKLDVDSNRGSATQYGVRSIPTLVLFKNGKEVNRFVGVKNKSFLINEINKVK